MVNLPSIFRRTCHWLFASALVFTGLLGAGRLPAAEAQGRSPVHVPGQYIVVLKDTVPNPSAAAAEMARQHGLGLLHVYEVALKGFAATMPEARLQALMNDPRVSYVEPDGLCFAIARPKPDAPADAAPQELPTGIDRIDAEASSTVANNGSGSVDVDVAVIDTGIQKNHPELYVVGGQNFSGGNVNNWNDENGHGTHVAGTIAAKDNSGGVVGVAPGARLWAVKVLNRNGSGT